MSHLERELELNGLEAPDEMQINTVTQQASKPNREKTKPTCHHCKKQGHYRNQCRQLKRESKMTPTKLVPVTTTNVNNNRVHTNSNIHNNKTVTNGNANNANNRKEEKPGPVYPPFENCGKTNHSTEKCYFGANAANIPPPWNRKPMEQSPNKKQDTQISTIGIVPAAAQALN